MSTILGNSFNISKLNKMGLPFIFETGLILQFLSISRRDFVSNSRLLVESTTQIGAKIALLSGAAYPEFSLINDVERTPGLLSFVAARVLNIEQQLTGAIVSKGDGSDSCELMDGPPPR